ncbi:hypothetical protein GCM10007235_11300 [Pseudoxanthomonas indica]|nr:hypothetical protein GCM10007235_11300 [Pseudoxanthomonas indica]
MVDMEEEQGKRQWGFALCQKQAADAALPHTRPPGPQMVADATSAAAPQCWTASGIAGTLALPS